MTIKSHITEYLKTHGASWGGQIEDYVRSQVGSKGGTTSRRLREMVDEKLLDVCYKAPEGMKVKCARYRLHQEPKIEIKPYKVSISLEGYDIEYPIQVNKKLTLNL